MLVSRECCEDIAKDIVYEFEELLCNNDVKINNLNSEENEFEDETSYINKKDKEKLTEEIIKQLRGFASIAKDKFLVLNTFVAAHNHW